MNGFNGQLTAHGLNGCMTFVSLAPTPFPYYVKAFFIMKSRTYAIFKAILS